METEMCFVISDGSFLIKLLNLENDSMCWCSPGEGQQEFSPSSWERPYVASPSCFQSRSETPASIFLLLMFLLYNQTPCPQTGLLSSLIPYVGFQWAESWQVVFCRVLIEHNNVACKESATERRSPQVHQHSRRKTKDRRQRQRKQNVKKGPRQRERTPSGVPEQESSSASQVIQVWIRL